MKLVTSKEIAKAIKFDNYGLFGRMVGWILLKALRISTINKVYQKHKHLKDLEFLNTVLDDFKIKFDIPEEDLKRIPKEGAFISISNHPLGGIDGVLLLKLMLESRADFKIIGNFLIHKIEPLRPFVLPVNPFDEYENHSSYCGLKAAISHVQNGNSLGIFPAGEVSTYKDGQLIIDKPWNERTVKLIRKLNVPVVPIYFHAKNSWLFYVLSKINDKLRTAKLPSELLTQKNRIIKVRIGKPISVKEQNELTGFNEYYEFLRKKTYMLAQPYHKKINLFRRPTIKIPGLKKLPKDIVKQGSVYEMIYEIELLKKTDARLLESNNYEVYFAKSDQIPSIMYEIGRLREITFREVGEGTNESIDIDQYDTFYHHLILWDREAHKIAGAYRMGLGEEIYKKFGIEGFYVHSLFRLDPELYEMMSHTIEMGRAFIIKEYQQKPMPLFLLWKGIVHVTLRYPNHKFLMGGVSISNKFSDFSKSLMIEFMRSNYYDPFIAQFVRPKKEYKVKLKDVDKDFVFDATKADLNKFDKIIEEIEPGALRLPVLIKKYVKQNAKLVAFNVDPAFNNAIDGLMYIRVADLPESTVKPVLEEYQAELEKKCKDA
ncbi:MAG: lysophospholipid acyltransferase family protein [Flavobacteriaceae bacterium]|nr:lysophospholipid acyltransferase family protein [Flavobacteriaceae bacterium]